MISTQQETICKHEIRNINWACQDADDLTHFAYITKDQESTQDHFCHVFQVSSMVNFSILIRLFYLITSFNIINGDSCFQQDLATEVILTLGQAFEVAYQLVLRQEMTNPSNDHESSQLKSNCQSNVQTPSAINAPVPTAVTSPVAPEPAVTTVNNNNKVIGVRPTVAADPTRKIGPKPTVLPPKPKLGTILFKQRPTGSNSISHARSHSSVDGVLGSSSGASSAMIETRLLSESNLASLQGSNRPTSTMASHPSTTSVTSTGSGRAPLAAKDEL